MAGPPVRPLAGWVVVAAAWVTSAGACRSEQPGPPPQPAELGAADLPEGAATTGLAATYAALVSTDRGACFDFVGLRLDGTAELGQGCTTGAATDLIDEAATWDVLGRRGDYGWRAGELTVRVTGWDPLAEQFELAEYTGAYCASTLALGRRSGGTVRAFDLIDGTPPADAEPCRP